MVSLLTTVYIRPPKDQKAKGKITCNINKDIMFVFVHIIMVSVYKKGPK